MVAEEGGAVRGRGLTDRLLGFWGVVSVVVVVVEDMVGDWKDVYGAVSDIVMIMRAISISWDGLQKKSEKMEQFTLAWVI